MREKWKDVSGYEGIYQVSSLGQVRSISNTGRHIKKTLSTIRHGERYLYVTLMKNGHRKNHYVHRLVAMAFIENPNGFQVVNHIDYDTFNNATSNLEWCSQKQNVLHSVIRMSKPRLKPMTNTGERYISFRKSRSEYRLNVPGTKEQRFKDLESAVAKREEILGG